MTSDRSFAHRARLPERPDLQASFAEKRFSGWFWNPLVVDSLDEAAVRSVSNIHGQKHRLWQILAICQHYDAMRPGGQGNAGLGRAHRSHFRTIG